MEGYIPEDIVDRIRSSTDIVDLVSQYVTLKKSGANFLGLCPFHKEKTPSFSVSASKQIYHCFGCGAGGDAVGFLMRHENYTFPEALKYLADKAGIKIPERTRENAAGKGEYEELLRINAAAMEFFAECLKGRAGAGARKYLEGRGMAGPEVADFALGYSPPAWDGLLGHLGKMGIGPEKAERAGVALKKTSGRGYYDRFRDRLMFPIRDARGRVVGFGGRVMGEGEPKYLNSPETRLFKKGEMLYGLDVAAEHIRKKGYAIITEGYFDAIACHKAGIKNAVATLGTALTHGHLRLLKRYCRKVALIFDSDEAGLKAAERSLDIFLGTELSGGVALLPAGDDPDTYIAREGAGGLMERLRESEKLAEFVIKRVAAGAETIEQKMAAAARLTDILAKMENSVERGHYLKVSADELGVDERDLAEELGKKLGRSAAVFTGPKRRTAEGMARIEEQLLHLAMGHQEVAAELGENLSPEDFTTPACRKLAGMIFELVKKGVQPSPHKLLDGIRDEELKGLVLSLSMKEEVEDFGAAADGAIKRLVKQRHIMREHEIQAQIAEAEKKGDLKLQKKLARDLNDLVLKRGGL